MYSSSHLAIDQAAHNNVGLAQGPRPTNVIDQSGSGSILRRSKWIVKDGYLEMHLTMGPSVGKFTNNLLAWLREEGAIDEALADIDWIRLPQLLQSKDVSFDQVERTYAAVAVFLRRYTKTELMTIAMKRKLLLAPIATTADLGESPHLAERAFWLDVEDSTGRKQRLPGPFAHTTSDAFAFRRAAPRLGEHNHAVYAELAGISEEVFRELKRQGVIS